MFLYTEKPVDLNGRRKLRASTFDLNEDDLEEVTPMYPSIWLAMILPDGNHVDYACRLLTSLAIEAYDLPLNAILA